MLYIVTLWCTHFYDFPYMVKGYIAVLNVFIEYFGGILCLIGVLYLVMGQNLWICKGQIVSFEGYVKSFYDFNGYLGS